MSVFSKLIYRVHVLVIKISIDFIFLNRNKQAGSKIYIKIIYVIKHVTRLYNKPTPYTAMLYICVQSFDT